MQEVNNSSTPLYFDLLTVTHPKDQLLVSQENHYYPFGMALHGVAVNTSTAPVPSKQLFNAGAALQDELLGDENGVYETRFRSYDPTIGRFMGVDPLADSYADLTPYQYAANDPMQFNDPMGDKVEGPSYNQCMYCGGETSGSGGGGGGGFGFGERGYGGSPVNDWGSGIFGGGPGFFGPSAGGGSNIGGRWNASSSENLLADFTKRFGGIYQGGRMSYSGFNYTIHDGIESTKTPWKYTVDVYMNRCASCVDPASLHNNLFGLSYPGGDNPRSYDGKYTYAYVPETAAEYPAIGHDRRYDNLKATGAAGLFTDRRAIGADYRFVAEEYATAMNSFFSGDFRAAVV